MKNKKLQVAIIIDVIMLAVISVIKYFDKYFIPNFIFLDGVFVRMQIVILIGIVGYWLASVYRRVMDKRIRNYLCLFAFMIIALFLFRCIKWYAFGDSASTARLFWYMFYIPMILIPLLGLFIVVTIKCEEVWNKRVKFLMIPALLLVAFVLTNDMHQFVFKFNDNFYNWDYEYKYNFGYFFVMGFMMIIPFIAVLVLMKKRRDKQKYMKNHMPIFVLIVAICYMALYILNRNIASTIMDLTVFVMMIVMLFWECCIQVGFIPSNKFHEELFREVQMDAQILDKNGKCVYLSKNAEVLPRENFEMLKSENICVAGEKEIELGKINNGWISYSKDISANLSLGKELKSLSEELYGDIAFLEIEQELKAKRARIKKQNEIYNVISNEILPYIAKINEILNHGKSCESQDECIKKVNIIGCYIKRKTNLLLQAENGQMVDRLDMISCYNEVFKALEIYGVDCEIKYESPDDMPFSINMACFDLFGEIIEKLNFDFKMIFINCFEVGDKIRYSITIESKAGGEDISKMQFETSSNSDCDISVEVDDDCAVIIFQAPKSVEVKNEYN